MSAQTTITGNIGQTPELRYAGNGKPYINISVCCTPRRLNKQTNQWENLGIDLWIRATFWENDAEKLAEILTKGTRITIEGTLALIAFTSNDGQQRTSLELTSPRFLGIIPRHNTPTEPQNTPYNTQQTQTYTHTYPHPTNTPQNATQQTTHQNTPPTWTTNQNQDTPPF